MQSGYIHKLIQEEVKLLFERLTLFDAVKIFQKYGMQKVAGMTHDEKKLAYIELVKKYHPDKQNGDSKAMQEINDAWDTLKDQTGGYKSKTSYSNQSSDNFNQQSKSYHKPEADWSWAGYSGGMPNSDSIYQNNFHDMNFVKKTAWEVSGKPKTDRNNEYTFWQWDGRYNRAVLTVFAIPDTLFKISEMFSVWGKFNKTKAVLVTHKSEPNIAIVVSAYGEKINPPKKYMHESFNTNPFNDEQFTSQLRNDYP